MKTDNASSASGSATTSAAHPQPDTPPAQLTESQYLAQQADQAKAAMAAALARIKSKLAQGVAPQEWARQYPWITVAAAAAAGFVAATSLIPSKEEQALKKLAAIERAVNPKLNAEHTNGKEKKENPGLINTLLKEALAIARPALVSMISAGLVGGAQMPTPDEGQQDGVEPGSTA
jgi:hypothetical protein